MMNQTYLVISGTGRQGRSVVDALIEKGATSIVVSSRNPEGDSAKKLLALDGVTKCVKADLSNTASLVAAIKESGADRIWFMTDWNAIKSPTRAKEAQLGYNVIDAIKESGVVKHVVFNSVGDADNCSESVELYWSKADIEKYMKKELPSSTTWSILRPVAFFENVDDPANYNPLSKGKVKFLTYENVSLKYIATKDIGKAAAVMLVDPEKYHEKVVEAAGGEHTGTELATALTEASGTPCTYSMALPRDDVWNSRRDLYHMVSWIESDGYSADIDEFKKIVPDAMDAKAWFLSKGRWADGEKFKSGESTN